MRNDLRQVQVAYINYEIAKRNFELNVRLKDQAFEQIVAPPAAGGGGLAQTANAATQTTNLLSFQSAMITAMLALTNGWQIYETQRLIVYRDIGILPYDEWEAFSELFPAQYHGPIIGHAPPGAQDLPRLQRPARRRLNPAKMGATGLAVLLAAGASCRLPAFPGMSKPIKGLLTSGKTDVITTVVRKGALPITVVEKGSLESSENKDAYCLVEGQTTIIMIKPEGTAVKKGELVCQLDSAALTRSAGQPKDHDQECGGKLRERQADPRSRRDRGGRVRGRHLQARSRHGRRRDQARRVRP